MILLVNPWIHDFSTYNLWMQPLGLLYLAAVLEDNGLEVQYINCLDRFTKILPDGRGKLAKEILPVPPVLHGIKRKYGRYGISVEEFRNRLAVLPPPEAVLVTSGMTYWYPGVQETIHEMKRFFPGTRILLGGIYATLMPDHARRCSGADFVYAGQAEKIIVSLLTGKEGKHYTSIDDYPTPAWHLAGKIPYRILLTSRGCPYRCTFCASNVLNEEKFLQRRWEKVLAEIEQYYYNHNITEYVFYDDALLIGKRKHLQPLLQELVRRSLPLHFHTPNGLNAREIDPSLAELMYAAGFRTIRLSLESASSEIQKHQGNNKINNDLFRKAVGYLYQAGYRPGELECYLIMGLPGQTREDVLISIDFVCDLGVIPRLATFSPIPGTPEAEQARKQIGDAFFQEPLLQNHSCFPLRNRSMTEEDLQSIKLYSKQQIQWAPHRQQPVSHG